MATSRSSRVELLELGQVGVDDRGAARPRRCRPPRFRIRWSRRSNGPSKTGGAAPRTASGRAYRPRPPRMTSGPAGRRLYASRAMTSVFSGIQPTGDIHLGNYLGAVRHWVGQDQHRARRHLLRGRPPRPDRCPADPAAAAAESTRRGRHAPAGRRARPGAVHALRAEPRPRAHRAAPGCWSASPPIGELRRMTQFKEKRPRARSRSASACSTYPVLMAADILLYDTDRVPVGDDQRQHLELTRDLAIRFNHRYGDTFVVPEATHPRRSAPGSWTSRTRPPRCRSRPTRPRARSCCSTTRRRSPSKIKRAVTDTDTEVRYDPDAKPGRVEPAADPGRGHRTNRCRDVAAEFAGSGYGAFKAAVAEAVVEYLRPVRERYEELRARSGRGRPHPRGRCGPGRGHRGRRDRACPRAVGLLPRG